MFLDKYSRYRSILNMQNSLRGATSYYGEGSMHKIGPTLKGKKKTLHGYAYRPKTVTKGKHTFKLFKHRAYQVGPHGEWLRCSVTSNNIIPRY